MTTTSMTVGGRVALSDPHIRGIAVFYGLDPEALGVLAVFGRAYPSIPELVTSAFFDTVLTRPGLPPEVVESFDVEVRPLMLSWVADLLSGVVDDAFVAAGRELGRELDESGFPLILNSGPDAFLARAVVDAGRACGAPDDVLLEVVQVLVAVSSFSAALIAGAFITARDARLGAADEVLEVATTLEELSRTLAAASGAQGLSGEVGRTREELQALDETGREVSEVIGFVRRIADKTNLLALNATIEAARVGEAGLGFQVVAGEVKLLSRTTKEALGRIESAVTRMEAAIERSGSALDAAAAVTAHVVDASTQLDEVAGALARRAQRG